MARLFIDDDGSVLPDVGDLTLDYPVRAGDDISASDLAGPLTSAITHPMDDGGLLTVATVGAARLT